MNIDKNIPIYQIVIRGNEISEYYSQKSIYSWNQLGYNNIQRVDAVTPTDLPGFIKFSDVRRYTKKREREWIPEEKAICYSHYKCWAMVKEPSIIIEHDCMLYRELPDILLKRNLWSFGMTDKQRNLAALGYVIKKSGAKQLMHACTEKKLLGPIDGLIHHFQPWYKSTKSGKLSDGYTNKFVAAQHYIDPEVGTTKPKAKKP